MADNTQDAQNQAVQPTQPQVNINTNTVELKGKDIYAKMLKFGDAQNYRAESRVQGVYYNFKYGGAIVTAPEEFADAYANRQLYSVTITGRAYNREVPDPNNAGQKMIRTEQAWSLDGFLTIEDFEAAAKGELKIQQIETQMARAANTLKVKAKDVKDQMTDDELQKLLEEA